MVILVVLGAGLLRMVKLILHLLKDLFLLCLRFLFGVDDDSGDDHATNDVENSHCPEFFRTWRVGSVPRPTSTAKEDKGTPPGCLNSRKNQREKDGEKKKPGKGAGKVDFKHTFEKIEERDRHCRVFREVVVEGCNDPDPGEDARPAGTTLEMNQINSNFFELMLWKSKYLKTYADSELYIEKVRSPLSMLPVPLCTLKRSPRHQEFAGKSLVRHCVSSI